MAGFGCQRVAVFTDRQLRQTPSFQTVMDALAREKVEAVCFDEVAVEPTLDSMRKAIAWMKDQRNSKEGIDGLVALGGGSVMDTAKMASVYSTLEPERFLSTRDFDQVQGMKSEDDEMNFFMAFVSPPIGLGLLPLAYQRYHRRTNLRRSNMIW